MVYYNRTDKNLYIPDGIGNDGCESTSVETVNLTQEEYDALTDPDCNTFYCITDEEPQNVI